MFSISTLKTNLYGMIGLRDSDDPDMPLCTLTAASQSVYFNDYHSLVTFDQLYHVAPNYDGMNYTTWTSTGYATGSYAMYDKIAYKSTRTMTTGDTPSLTGTGWESPVNDWIQNKQYASISKLCNQLFTSKKINESAKTFLDSVQVVDGAGRQADTVTGSSRFVGFEINLKRANNIKAVLNYIGLQFTASQTFTVYLFHSSQKAAVGTWSVTNASATSFDWVTAASPTTGTNELHYVNYSGNIDSGGKYYIGYFEDDISGSAIEKHYDCDTKFKWSKWAEIRPIAVESGSLDGTNIFDIDDVGYADTNFGLNFSFSIKSDITEMIVNNKGLFVDAMGYQFASDMLQEMIFNSSSRINALQDTAKRNAVLYEWNGQDNRDSIVSRLNNAKEALSFDLSKISQVVASNGPRIKIGNI